MTALVTYAGAAALIFLGAWLLATALSKSRPADREPIEHEPPHDDRWGGWDA